MSDKESRDLAKRLARVMNSPPKQIARPVMEVERDVNHPVYHTISYINGQINRMSIGEMKSECKSLNLDCHGKREAVKRRLKEHYKAQKLIEAGLMSEYDNRNVDYFIVIDFEATCEEKNPPGYQHEIIEFPAVLVDTSTSPPSIKDVFHSFCRPVINPILSQFCRDLTQIEQSTVDKADPFPQVHERFVEWLTVKHGLGSGTSFAVVTDGPFDIGRFLYLQFQQLGLPFPDYAKTWVNIRKAFANFYKGDFYAHQGSTSSKSSSARLPGLQTMLSSVGLEFQGQPHSGLDDAKNIARILIRLISDRAFIRINEAIMLSQEKLDVSSNARLRTVIPVARKEAEALMKKQKKKPKEDISDSFRKQLNF